MNNPQNQNQNKSNNYKKKNSTIKTPIKKNNHSYNNENQNITPKSTPNQKIQPILKPTYTPNPNHKKKHHILNPITQKKPTKTNNQTITHQQSKHKKKILNITKLKIIPKLL